MFSLKRSPRRGGWEGVGVNQLVLIDLLIYITCHIFMCFMYLFQPLLPDPHSNMIIAAF